MTYVEGFVVPVPTDKREAYVRHATEAAAMMREAGVGRMVETWGDDVPDGKVTDFPKAVMAGADESIVFSWFEYPSRAERDAAIQRMMADPRMAAMAGTMPFDGRRMIMGGFEALIEEGDGRGLYVDGFLVPVPRDRRDAYREAAATMAALCREQGALRTVEAWADDVPDGEVTDFRKAVKAGDEEEVVFSWIEWASREARDAGWKALMADERMQAEDQKKVFDGRRLVHGGFALILDA